MQILNQLETQPIPIEAEEKRHSRRLLVGLTCALFLTGTVLGGFVFLITRHERNVAVELQLRKRVAGGVETRAVNPVPTELPPDGKARYTLELPVQNYISATFLRVIAGDDHAEVTFKTLPGAPRPPMDPPAAKSIMVSRPAPRGDEFINTPSNPGRVP